MDGEMLTFEPESVMELQWGPDVIGLSAAPGRYCYGACLPIRAVSLETTY